MTLLTYSRIAGLLGDAITFTGAILLALGEAGEEARTRERISTIAAYKSFPDLKKLVIEIGGVIIKDEEDIEFAIVHPFARRARKGAWIIATGFVFLLISRILDILA